MAKDETRKHSLTTLNRFGAPGAISRLSALISYSQALKASTFLSLMLSTMTKLEAWGLA